MPKLGLAMTEGSVVKWLREDGATVRKDEPIVQVMSKKITYEVKAPAAGVLRHVARPKDSFRVGAVIGFITAPGEAVPEVRPVAPVEPAVAAAAAAERATVAAVPGPAAAQAAAGAAGVLATPMARRLAREHGLDLRQVPGSGPGGRVTERDVLAYVEAPKAAPPAAAGQVIPFAGPRQAIAERMTESLRTMAQVTLTTEADVTPLVEFREALRRRYEVSYTDLVIKAVAAALRAHPALNSTLVGDEIHLLQEVNVGFAVALDDGLMVPVVRNADRLSLQEVARETARLAEAARGGNLTVDEVTGATFTVTNLGGYGVDAFTPIINPPEVGILGVGRIVEKPAVHRGSIAVRSLMALSLTFDHRIVDGAPAAAFLRTVREFLEQPALMFGP